jgi:hypothetical protein
VNYWALGFALLTIIGSGVVAALALRHPFEDSKATIVQAVVLMHVGFSALAAILIPSGIVSIMVQALFGAGFVVFLVTGIRLEIASLRRRRLKSAG